MGILETPREPMLMRTRADPSRVPILLYHGVTTKASPAMGPYAVGPPDFARHLDLVLASGRRAVTVADLMALLGDGTTSDRDGGEPPEGLAAVTFDDGFADLAEVALPMLVDRGIPATVYVTTGWTEGNGARRRRGPQDRMLSVGQLAELRDAGLEIGAHSHTHPTLDSLTARDAREELRLPRLLLEDALGVPVTSLAYPHGYSSPRIRALARDLGYDNAVAVRNALATRGDDRFRVPRLMVMADTPPDAVADWLHGSGAPVGAGPESPRTRLGRRYRRARAAATGRPVTAWPAGPGGEAGPP